MLRELDVRLLRFLRTHGHQPPIERAVVAFSRLGEHSALWFMASALGIVAQRRRRSLYVRLARTLATVEIANALAKIVIGRRRPILEGLPALMATRSQRSFPSAHAASSFAAARVLSEIHPALPVYGVAGAMALSRPYLGVHYPSDVLGGAALGTAISELVRATSAKADRGPGSESGRGPG